MDLMDGVAPPTAPQQQNPKYQLIGEESASEAVYLLAPKVKRSYRTPHFIDRRHLPELLTAARPLYAEWKNLLVWNKSNAGQGCFYRSKHELIAVFKNGTAPHINNLGLGGQGRYRANVLD